MKRSIVRVGGAGKGRRRAAGTGVAVEGASCDVQRRLEELNVRVEAIQALIPLGLEAVNDLLQAEVTQLAGARYSRQGGQAGHDRWGSQKGSVHLADQKLSIRVPRVRNVITGAEVLLPSYGSLQDQRRADEIALRKVLKGLSCREYESCVEPVAETFGLKASKIVAGGQRSAATGTERPPETPRP